MAFFLPEPVSVTVTVSVSVSVSAIRQHMLTGSLFNYADVFVYS